MIGKIIVLLKVLSNLKSNSEESYMFLLNVSLSEIGDEHEYIKNLAEAVLSYNLCEKGADSIVNESLKSRIALLLKRSLSSFSDNKLDTEDLKRRMLVEKIIARGEDNSIEFKASLDVPVLSKDLKLAILEQKEKLNLEIDVEKKQEIKSRIHELSNINTSDKRLISLVNLSIIKTIAAFANTSGGHLLIGVDENELGEPYVLGLNADLNKHKNKDGILLRLDEIVHKFIGNGMHSALIQSIDFVSYKGKEIILIAIKKSAIPIFVKIDSEKKFFIRRQASTTCLNSHELFEFMMHTGVISKMDNQS